MAGLHDDHTLSGSDNQLFGSVSTKQIGRYLSSFTNVFQEKNVRIIGRNLSFFTNVSHEQNMLHIFELFLNVSHT